MEGVTSALVRKIFSTFGRVLRTINILRYRLAGVSIGNNCMVSLRAKIDNRRGRVIIGDNSSITYGCVILSHDQAAKRINPKRKTEWITEIGSNVFIGVNSVILPNFRIGDRSIIGAGSVVTKDVPSGVIVGGNPAVVLRKVGESPRKQENRLR